MTVGDLMEKLKGVRPDTRVCTAEVDEAFGMNIADIEIVEQASVTSREADGKEAVELGNGKERVVVLRW